MSDERQGEQTSKEARQDLLGQQGQTSGQQRRSDALLRYMQTVHAATLRASRKQEKAGGEAKRKEDERGEK